MKNIYRPEIDGLRAIAVGAVILYHAQITILDHQPFKGGFIGVDIFFVISGYLITSIILKELVTTGSFSFKHFYERRIRRILPALLFVMLVSLPFAWMYLLPSSFVDFSKSILYSLGFSSNFYFHYSGQQYGAESGLFKPFLHTWSLSVEEQFYILFPLVLLVTFKYLRKYLIHILVLGFFISLGLAEWTSRHYSSTSFYFIHTRAWELLIGSILAYFEITKGHRSKNKILNLILPSTGLLLIGHSILFFNDEMFHPSFYTLSPVIGVSLIIWFSSENELTTKILSTKLFVGIGLISYSLYLWHYPIFAFARTNEFFDSTFLYITILFLVILSIFSYFYIEKPFRDRKNNFRKIFKIIFTSIFTLILITTFIIYKNGKVDKRNTFIESQISSPLYSDKCKFNSTNLKLLNERINQCKKSYDKFILILGDSHSIDLYNSISKISNQNEFIIGFNKGGCTALSIKLKNCHYYNALDLINENKDNIKVILFTLRGNHFFEDIKQLPIGNQIYDVINYIKEIKKTTENIIFIGPHLEPNIKLDRKNLLDYFYTKKKFKPNINYDIIELDKRLKKLANLNHILYISKIDILNFKFEEDFIVDGNFTFSDYDHWSEYGEIYFGKKIIFKSRIKDILFPQAKLSN